jgi:hypothetical protein
MPSLPDDAPEDAATGVPDGAPPALGDLRAAVRRAAEEVGRLREKTGRLEGENGRLRARVTQLEADPSAGRDGTALLLDDDPEALRERIDQFIDAIDAHL